MKLTTTIFQTVPAELATEVNYLLENEIFKSLNCTLDDQILQSITEGAKSVNQYYFDEALKHPTEYNLNKLYELFVSNHVDYYRNEETGYGVFKFHFLDVAHLETNSREILELAEATANSGISVLNPQGIHEHRGNYLATDAGICDLDNSTFTTVMPIVISDVTFKLLEENFAEITEKLKAFPEVYARVEALYAA